MHEIVQHTSISTRKYIEDYLRFGIRNRYESAKALLSFWAFLDEDERLLRGAKVLQEYGGAIEDLFANAYAAYKQCSSSDDLFLRVLLGYRSSELGKFKTDHCFSDDMFALYHLPEPHLLAPKFGRDSEYVRAAVAEIGALLEDLKSELHKDEFLVMYNKLKHGFPVVSPKLAPANHNLTLGILLVPGESRDEMVIGKPLRAGLTNLTIPFNNIFSIMCCTGVLLKAMLFKFEIESQNR